MASNKNIGLLVAFASGVAVGTALGILYAPDEGKNTRDKLTFRLSKYRDKLKDMVSGLTSEDGGILNEAKAESQKVVADTKEKAERMLADVDALIDQIRG
jgi:gas vesicle protein